MGKIPLFESGDREGFGCSSHPPGVEEKINVKETYKGTNRRNERIFRRI